MNINDKIAKTIQQGNFEEYQKTRYPTIQDGEEVIFSNQDFSGVDFSKFSVGFFKFIQSNIDDTKGLYGQPIIIESCSAKRIDLRNVRAIIHAKDSDFTDIQINESTILSYGNDKSSAVSTFTNCIINPETLDLLKHRGVVID